MNLSVASFRLLSETLSVTDLADNGPGTLREAIGAAAENELIQIAVPGTITLNSELAVDRNLTISGLGANQTTVSGNNNSRVFYLVDGAVAIAALTISDGRVEGTNGLAGMKGENVQGGGILIANGALLQLSACVVSNNIAVGGQGGPPAQSGGFSGDGGNGFGGGIANFGGLTIAQCRLVANSASGGESGPATDGFPGMGGQGWGGGIYSESSGSILRSTMDANRAIAGGGSGVAGNGAGGGIYSLSAFSVTASTIVRNAATGGANDTGGGIDNLGTLTIDDSTIVGNSADIGGGVTGGDLQNSILAGNSAGIGPDGSGNITSRDFNLIQNTNGMFITGDTNHNIIGQDPLLGPLQDNGGQTTGFTTFTMAPLPGGPAIDQGNSTLADQRSEQRPFDTPIPDASDGNGADIGAIEIDQESLLVLNNNDSGFGSLRQAVLDNSTFGGNNEIEFATNVTGTITLTSGQITVNDRVTIRGPGAEELSVSANQNGRIFNVLAGPTTIRDLTLRDGFVVGSAGGSEQNGQDGRGGAVVSQSRLRVFSCVLVSNMVIGGMGGPATSGFGGTGGRGLGGAIYNAGGDLEVFGCTFTHNECVGGEGGSATTGSGGFAGNGLGGSVCSIGGTASLRFSSFASNQATGGQGGDATEGGSPGNGGQGYGGNVYNESEAELAYNTIRSGTAVGGTGGGGNGAGDGGGIYNLDDISVFTCTIVSNTASGTDFDSGGGIANFSTLAITNSTIVGNEADLGGGLSGNASLANTILAGNSAPSFGPDGSGTFTSQDFNLIQDTNGMSIMGTTTHDIIGQDPMLGPLMNNGASTLTMSPAVDSPVIDQGHSFGATIDQRFGLRPFDFPDFQNAAGGDGADIGAFELGVPPLGIRHEPPNVVLNWFASYTDVILEATTELPPTSGWFSVTNTSAIISNENFQVTDDASAGNKFYRLRSR